MFPHAAVIRHGLLHRFCLRKRPNFSVQAGRIGKQLYYDSPKTHLAGSKLTPNGGVTRLLVLPHNGRRLSVSQLGTFTIHSIEVISMYQWDQFRIFEANEFEALDPNETELGLHYSCK
jgi:hypothetical protein